MKFYNFCRAFLQLFRLPVSGVAAALFVILLAAPMAAYGVTLELSPNSITNFYQGSIALQVEGIEAGENVLVEKFLDINGDGKIDSTDYKVQEFKLTDGFAALLGNSMNGGEHTNFNVPGDFGEKAGEITSTLQFRQFEPDHSVGNYIYRATGKSGAATALFTIANADFPQTINGTVSNGGVLLPGVMVLLLDPHWEYLGGATTDLNGRYIIAAPPGEYHLLPIKSGHLARFSGDPTHLENAQIATANLVMQPGERTISGKVSDISDLRVGLPGVWIFCEEQSGLATFVLTDGDGSFSVSCTPVSWWFLEEIESLNRLGYLRKAQRSPVDAALGNMTGVTLPALAANALINFGTVTSNTSMLQGIRVISYRNDGRYETQSTTDGDGNYSQAVIAEQAWFSVDPRDMNRLDVLFPISGGTIEGSGSGMDFHFQADTRFEIQGRLEDETGAALPRIIVNVRGELKTGGGVWTKTTTDANGSFLLKVFGGDRYQIEINREQARMMNVVAPLLTLDWRSGGASTNLLLVARTSSSHINGSVKGPNGAPIVDLFLDASTTINGTNYHASHRAMTMGVSRCPSLMGRGTWGYCAHRANPSILFAHPDRQ
jgi:hypothetical protein